ncbi:MAG: hypothetical protein GY950_29675 [bacterium]|nr:hypothetical protein [bacterium]
MTEEIETGAAARRFALMSSELTGSVALLGTARLLEESPVGHTSDASPGLYRRRFELSGLEVIRGSSAAFEEVNSITFFGFTMLAPGQRTSDTRSPTLHLEGQVFFDSTLPPAPMNLLLLVGGPPITPIRGFMGHAASIENGVHKGKAVRAFLLEGADVTLPRALLSLAGWQTRPTLAAARTAAAAPHPLAALDALRIAVRSGKDAQVELLARWLLHPAQPAGAKVAAIELLGHAAGRFPCGSKKNDTLIGVAVAGWEAERAYPIDNAYLRALQSISGHVKMSSYLDRVGAIADDYHIHELTTLSAQLVKSLRGKKGTVKKCPDIIYIADKKT